MANSALNGSVFIFAGEFPGIGTRIRVRCAIRIPFESNGGHSDDWPVGKPFFQFVVFRLAFSQTEPPAVIVDHDLDMIRVVE